MSKVEKHKSKKSAFEDEIRNKDKAVVLFYASWCSFSQRFLPIFRKYAKNSPQECISVVVDDNPDLCEEYSIEYYPTVILFKNGKIHRRLDSEPGIGLNEKQLEGLNEKP